MDVGICLRKERQQDEKFPAVVGQLMWWNPAIFNVKLLSRTLQQLTGGIDSAQLWDEVVQFSQLVLRELQFWAHNTVEMATCRKPMILPLFEDLEIEWTHRQRPRWPRTRVCKNHVHCNKNLCSKNSNCKSTPSSQIVRPALS